MTETVAIELNDFGVVATTGSAPSTPSTPSIGIAVVESSNLQVGAAAAAKARLHPRLAHRRIWSELSTHELPRPFPRGLRTADLAYAHLRSIWAELEGEELGVSGPILLVAPGSFSEEQMSLILGLSTHLGKPLSGIVDAAVSAASTLVATESVVVDLELGRATATLIGVDLSATPPTVERVRVRSQEGAGWNALLDAWIRVVARGFVSRTRFDPLHSAAAEQRLYDLLPTWLDGLADRTSLEASFEASDRTHTLVLEHDEIAAAARGSYDSIVELARTTAAEGKDTPEACRLLVTHRVERAPGLTERLESSWPGEVVRLPASAALDGALAHSEEIPRQSNGALGWVTRLPVLVGPQGLDGG